MKGKREIEWICMAINEDLEKEWRDNKTWEKDNGCTQTSDK